MPARRPPVPARPAAARSRWGARLLRRAVVVLLAVLVLAAAVFGVAWLATPGVDDAQQRVAAELAAHGGTPLTGDLPPRISAALLATEDSHFADHPGVDWHGLLRAPLGLVTGNDQGGSTLDQQLARRIYEDGANDPIAKARAVALAVKLDHTWSKEQVLRMYLDASYFGHGFYGVVSAARGYFGRAPEQLTWAQATVLVGLVQAPSAYDPFVHPGLAKARQAHVLDRLAAVGSLSRTEADQVAAEPWDLVGS